MSVFIVAVPTCTWLTQSFKNNLVRFCNFISLSIICSQFFMSQTSLSVKLLSDNFSHLYTFKHVPHLLLVRGVDVFLFLMCSINYIIYFVFYITEIKLIEKQEPITAFSWVICLLYIRVFQTKSCKGTIKLPALPK